MTSNKQAEKLT